MTTTLGAPKRNFHQIPSCSALQEAGYSDPAAYIRHTEQTGLSRACCVHGCVIDLSGPAWCDHDCPALSHVLSSNL